MKAKAKWKIRAGAHTPAHSLGTGDKCPHPRTQNAEFGFGLGGGTKVFYPLRPDYRRFKIPSFTSPGHTHSHVCVPFSFCRIVGNPLLSRYFLCITVYTRNIIYCAKKDFRALTASWGGGGGGGAPCSPPPWDGTDKIVN